MERSISDEIGLAICDTKYLSTRFSETSSSESVILAQIYSWHVLSFWVWSHTSILGSKWHFTAVPYGHCPFSFTIDMFLG